MVGRMAKFLVLVVVVTCVALSGCTKKPKIDLTGLRDAPGQGGALNANAGLDPFDGGAFDPSRAGAGAGTGAGGDGSAWQATDQPIAGGPGANFLKNSSKWSDIVYFAFDKAEVPASERSKVESLAQHLKNNPADGVIIEGNCDDRGSEEYNRALSERRSLSVQAYLETLGVTANRVMTVGYGEDRPVVSGAQTEEEHQRNRRAEFLFGPMR